MKEEKLVSIVIPVFNVENYLSKTLDCIIEQTYTNWELILVDDGSTDGSVDIAKKYSEKDKRIKVFLRESLPKGAPHCRNIGMDLAKGEYLIYLDSDDIIAPYCFKQRVDYMDTHECDFAVFPMIGFYNSLLDACGRIYGYKPQGDIVCALIARTLPFVVVTNIYKRKELIDKQIVWDTNLRSFQDSDYNLQAIRAGLTYEMSNLLPDYFYRLSTQNSICKKLSTATNCESQIGFLEKQTHLYGSDGKYNRDLKICAAQIYKNIIRVKGNKDITSKFVNIRLFEGKPFFRWRIKMISSLADKVSSSLFWDLFQLILTPVFYLRSRLCYRNWNKHNKEVYKELVERYHGELCKLN